MNPQNTSTSFLIATGHIRAMRGGAQSHMLTASDQPLRIGVGRCLNDRLGYFGFAERIWSEHEPWLGSAMRVVVEQDRPSCPPRRTATNATKKPLHLLHSLQRRTSVIPEPNFPANPDEFVGRKPQL